MTLPGSFFMTGGLVMTFDGGGGGPIAFFLSIGGGGLANFFIVGGAGPAADVGLILGGPPDFIVGGLPAVGVLISNVCLALSETRKLLIACPFCLIRQRWPH